MIFKFIKLIVTKLVQGKYFTQIARLTKLPVTAIKYFPYKNGNDCYSISKIADASVLKCKNGLPVPPQQMWQGYGQNVEEYLSSGELHTNNMLTIVNAAGFNFSKDNKILDLGSGSARMMRHLMKYAAENEIWGTDVSAEYVIWCKQYLSPPFHFATTTTIPHLPFEDNYFHFIYTGSVFTHMDDLPDAWLLEIRRVLAPGGMLYLTIHDEHTISLLETVYSNFWFSDYLNSIDFYKQNRDTAGIMVIGRSTDSQVFYDRSYFLKYLKNIYSVVSINEEAYGYQTAILLRK
jgi:ubiquinone/menaquinone biosynthesis C-methylase UbiE